MTEHVDVLVVGAGIAGIHAACRLTMECPGTSYLVGEARDSIGGTWDLFRYPGVRSDSDMYTLGFPFRPWQGEQSIADGAEILQYVKDTAAEFGVTERIRFRTTVTRTEWSTPDQRWTVTTRDEEGGQESTLTAGFVYFCSGYYRYDRGNEPAFPGREEFTGQVVHPQHWPEDLDYVGKKVVVIGSGATAVTLVPAMVERGAEKVTMLQRSPTWMISLPRTDHLARGAKRALKGPKGDKAAFWQNVLMSQAWYKVCQRAPKVAGTILNAQARRALQGAAPLDPHFVPGYQPWDQRLCVVPDSDLFVAIREGGAEVVTDTIETFTPTGIRLTSGRELEADIIVTATGLELQALGGAEAVVDGEPVTLADRYTYRGLMVSGVPNAAACIGYVNASWTLRADLAARYVCRLLRHMQAHDYGVAVPEHVGSDDERRPLLDLDAGYIQRAVDRFPKRGAGSPWDLRQSYLADRKEMTKGSVTDGMRFVPRSARVPATPAEQSTTSP